MIINWASLAKHATKTHWSRVAEHQKLFHFSKKFVFVAHVHPTKPLQGEGWKYNLSGHKRHSKSLLPEFKKIFDFPRNCPKTAFPFVSIRPQKTLLPESKKIFAFPRNCPKTTEVRAQNRFPLCCHPIFILTLGCFSWKICICSGSDEVLSTHGETDPSVQSVIFGKCPKTSLTNPGKKKSECTTQFFQTHTTFWNLIQFKKSYLQKPQKLSGRLYKISNYTLSLTVCFSLSKK